MQTPNGRELSAEELIARVREEIARGRAPGPAPADGLAPAAAAAAATIAPPQSTNGRAVHLKDLLDLHDREFVVQTYRTLLGREPDVGGLLHQLGLLRSGRSKVEIVGRMRFGREGRRRHVRVRGLVLPFAFQVAYRIPVLGYALRLPLAILRLPKTLRNTLRFEHHVMAQTMELRERMTALESRLDQARSGQAAELAQVRTAWEDQAEEVARVRTAMEAQAAELARTRTALEKQAGDMQRRIEREAAALRQAIHQQGDDRREPLEPETASRQATPESTQRRMTAEQVDALHRLSAAQEELRTQLERLVAATGELTRDVHELQQRKPDAATTASLERLKREVLLQDRRLGLLLEEARKRLPEPLGKEQLAVFDDAARHRLDAMYVSFEDEFRGTRDDIKARMQVYLPILSGCGAGTGERPVLDIGCGRGEWLELLSSNGLRARGLDLNRVMIEECRRLGLEVAEADALTHLRTLADGSLGALTGFHIIEHLPFDEVVALFDEASRVLAPGGVVIFESPNPANLQVAAQNFYVDPTHRNPLPSQTVSFMAEARGFSRVQVLPLHPMPEFEADRPGRTAVDAILNRLLFGPQEYAVIGFRP